MSVSNGYLVAATAVVALIDITLAIAYAKRGRAKKWSKAISRRNGDQRGLLPRFVCLVCMVSLGTALATARASSTASSEAPVSTTFVASLLAFNVAAAGCLVYLCFSKQRSSAGCGSESSLLPVTDVSPNSPPRQVISNLRLSSPPSSSPGLVQGLPSLSCAKQLDWTKSTEQYMQDLSMGQDAVGQKLHDLLIPEEDQEILDRRDSDTMLRRPAAQKKLCGTDPSIPSIPEACGKHLEEEELLDALMLDTVGSLVDS